MESDHYLQVLGSGDAFGSGGRNQTAFFVKTPELNFLIDCGAHTLSSLKKNNLSSSDVDVIVLSHFHGDHYAGIPYLLIDSALVAKRKKKLTIISPADGEWKIRQLFHLLYPGSETVVEELNLEFLSFDKYETFRHEKFSLTAFPAAHSQAVFPHSLKLCIGDRIVSYSGDTGWTEDLIEVAKNANIFICECNFFSTEMEGHLNYKLLEEKQTLFKCDKILLTHLGDEALERRSDIALEICEDNQILYF